MEHFREILTHCHHGTTALAKCLNDPKNATQIILENKEELLKKDFKNLLCSAKGSANIAATLHCLNDLMEMAMGHNSGERGQGLFKVFSRRYVAQYRALSEYSVNSMFPQQPRFEHACEEHPVQMQDFINKLTDRNTCRWAS